MKFSIQVKILLVAGFTILIILGLTTITHIRTLKQGYIATLEWQSKALVQNLLAEITKMNREQPRDENTLKDSQEKLSALCERFHELSNDEDNNVTHVFIIDKEGNILAHPDRTLLNTPIKGSNVRNELGWRKTITVLDENIYHTLTPILDEEGNFLAAIDIGFPQKLIADELRVHLYNAIKLALIYLILSCGVIFLTIHISVTRSLKYLAKIGERLSQGYLLHTIEGANREDEIARLGMVFVRISGYLQEIIEIAEHVAKGGLEHEVHRRSRRDVLGHALQDMLTYLQAVASLASKIARGDLRDEIPLRSDIDAFGRAMREMTTGLQTLIHQIRISAEQLASMGTNIASLAQKDMDIVQNSQKSVEKLVSTMTDMGMSAEEIALNMETLSTSVEHTSTSTLEMTTSITSIASSVTDLEQQTQKTILALQNATDTLQGVAEKAEASRQLSEETIQDSLEGQQAVEEVTASMDTIQQTNSSAVESITRFAQRTEDIGTILDVINEITDQSSLLALNASIIAAQAGSHGKGFAVIADEMRSLATKVSASTKNIAAIVQTVQQETKAVVEKIHKGTVDIEQGVKRTQEAQKRLEKITSSAERSSKVVSEIVEALQTMQKTTGHDMRIAMEKVHSMTAEITKSTNEQKSTTHDISGAVEQINSMAARTKEETNQQLEGVQEVLDVANALRKVGERNLQSSQQIEQTAGALDNQAQTLLQLVDRFKLRENHEALVKRQAIEAQALDKAETQALDTVEG